VTEVEDDEDGQGDVGGEEVGGGEFAGEEDLEAVGEGQDDEEDEGEVGHVGLEDGFVGPLLEHGVVGQGFAETLRVGCQGRPICFRSRRGWRTHEVGHHDADPRDESADGGEVEEPVEDGCRTGWHAEIDETREGGAEEDRDPGHSPLVACAEDRRCLAGDGQRVEGPRTGEEEGVAGRPGGSQDDGVDDVIEALDSGSLDT